MFIFMESDAWKICLKSHIYLQQLEMYIYCQYLKVWATALWGPFISSDLQKSKTAAQVSPD